MRTILRSLCVLVWLCGLSAQSLQAQWGGLLDKLQKLSGPEVLTYGFFLRVGYQPGQRLERRYPARISAALTVVDTLTSSRPAVEVLRDAQLCVSAILNSPVVDGQAYTESRIDRARAELRSISSVVTELQTQLMLQRDISMRLSILQARQNELRTRACDVGTQLTALTVAASARDPDHGWVWRIGLFHGKDIGEPKTDIMVWSIQPNVEYRFIAPLVRLNMGVEAGLNLHYFYGGGIDSFFKPSIPLLLNWHPCAGCRAGLVRNIRVGYGLHIFPPFNANDFAPALPNIEERWEPVLLAWPKFSIDISWSSWPFLLDF